MEGDVRISYPRGDVYYGSVQNYKKNGNGYLFFANGAKYVGEFKNGNISGMGSYYEKSKLLYEGLWEKGKFIKPISKSDE